MQSWCQSAIVLIAIHMVFFDSAGAQQPVPSPITKEAVDGWMVELSNWGRWGDEDQLGTLNLITPDKRVAAVRLVETGNVVSLARELQGDTAGPSGEVIGYQLRQSAIGAADTYTIDYHGFSFTHIDALAHIFADGRLYNGASTAGVTSAGASSLGIETMVRGLVTRAVLVDVPRLKSVPYLEPGAIITVSDLEDWERQTDVRIGSGDALLLSTGRWRRVAEVGPSPADDGIAGLLPSAARWLKVRDVAVLGCDCVSDRLPSVVEGVPFPLHQLAIVALGMPLLDNLDLTAVVEDAAALERWEFLLVVAPLRVVGGTGSPANPLAIF